MKHALLLALVVACSHAGPAAENAPPPPAAGAAVRAPAPPPGCYTPPLQRGSGVVLEGWSGTFVGSNAPVDCTPGNHDEAAIYCAHVHDPCCVPGGWTCNNARYVDWYAQQCRSGH